MKLIVGLGNPGKEYENTRHNIGFKMIDHIVNQLNLTDAKKKFNAEFWEYKNDKDKFIFLKPLSYMNLSGDPVFLFAKYFDIDSKDIIIIYDDKDLPFLDLKVKFNGSAGGHNGMKNIIDIFKTTKIKRIKIGIGYNQHYLIRDWVLSNFSNLEKKQFSFIYEKIDIIFDYLFKGIKLEEIISKNNFRKAV